MRAQSHLYLMALLFWLHFAAVALKTCRMIAGVAECWHGSGASLIVVCFGCECQLNACEVKIQTQRSRQGRPERAEQTDESKLSKEQVFFLLLFSLHLNPLAIVRQRAASLHMFGYCSITLPLPPAHSFNRPCWLTSIHAKYLSTTKLAPLPDEF